MTFVAQVLKLFADHSEHDAIIWSVDATGDIQFHVICSDCFFWGTADSEPITEENFPILEASFVDAKTALDSLGAIYAPILFVARVRQQRPQGAAYPNHPELWPLFDACGPKREIGIGNPRSHPADR